MRSAIENAINRIADFPPRILLQSRIQGGKETRQSQMVPEHEWESSKVFMFEQSFLNTFFVEFVHLKNNNKQCSICVVTHVKLGIVV